MTTSTPSAPLDRLVGFARYARRQGLTIGTGRVLTFCRAAAALDPFDPTNVRLAARSTLVSRHEDLAVLDALFERYFRGDVDDSKEQTAAESFPRSPDGDSEGMPIEEGEGQTAHPVVATDAERLRTKDFAALTEEERRTVFALIRRLALSIPLRHSRRYRPSPSGRRLDLRRTLRESLKTEGEPFRRAWKRRGARTRPLVVVLDVSGSMAPYGRPLVEFAHAAANAGRRVETFCFGTRLTRITRALATRDPAEALSRVGTTVTDWEGGTRIGHSMKELLDQWASRSALRGSVTVLCSDGLERGDPELLKKQMERLSRLVYRLIWVNPLKGSPRYEPLARGMAASLPFVDVFLPGHNLQSLEALSVAVAVG